MSKIESKLVKNTKHEAIQNISQASKRTHLRVVPLAACLVLVPVLELLPQLIDALLSLVALHFPLGCLLLQEFLCGAVFLIGGVDLWRMQRVGSVNDIASPKKAGEGT